jgi:hypothetical protein
MRFGNDTRKDASMNLLMITVELAGRDDASYQQQATAFAPSFTQVPGLISKVWLANSERNIYGGMYRFRDRAAQTGYLDSEIVQGLRANSTFVNVTVQVFGPIAAATAITGGPLAAASVQSNGGFIAADGDYPSQRLQAAAGV